MKNLKIGKSVNVLETRKDLGPSEYAEFAFDWIDQGAKIIGGCCEIGPKHIEELSDQLSLNGYKSTKV